ncbi:TetR family transcriptional regulator C-terminal domain-containing protein [Cnuibacter physcomitrellae]|uniref:TetR/AcrR family transcriptional regulator n=1 Tax=Cnuibacter physcomitrellae TaxID=1619308 RepID=UPI00217616E0|nr:TetR family transcriptional regulator C-terminal domain-containing protein [Cnuibacter physcomitrellae]MCS5496518.1 TetR family transcriptional regulator C-terminal domain-containing protein [Cnuibacter physcomitrellae]
MTQSALEAPLRGEVIVVAHMNVQERRARLVRAAFTVIAERGIAGATTRAITAEAGMALASFHYAFASRDELLTTLIADAVESETSALEVTTRDHASLEDVLVAGLSAYLDGLKADPHRERAMLELTQHAVRDPDTRALAVRQYERYRMLARRSLEAAADRTGSEWLVPVDELAAQLVALTDGLTLAWLVDEDEVRAEATIRFAARSLASRARPERARPDRAHPDRARPERARPSREAVADREGRGERG